MLNLSRYKNILSLLFILIIYNLFFVNKAFHIDDPSTIDIARAINKDFLNVPQVFFSNPILLGYYYAPIIKFLGEKEVWLHIFYLPFSLLTIISMFLLSLRFYGKGLLPTLSLVVTPAFLVMSHSIMFDIPLLGFFLGALAAFIYGTDRSDSRLLLLSSILTAMAVMIKYSGLMLIPLMVVYALMFSKKVSRVFIIIPVSTFVFWNIHNVIFYKQFLFIEALLTRIKMWSFDQILIRIFACLSFITGTSIVSLFLTSFFLRDKKNLFLLIISLPIGLCPFLIKRFFSQYSTSEKIFLALLFTSTFFIILIIFKVILSYFFKKAHNKDRLFLSLWFFAVLFFTIFSQFIAARFVLLLFPPMFLFLYSELNANRVYLFSGIKKIISALVFVVFIISTVLAVGDYKFSGAYRDFTVFLKKKIVLDNKVYFSPCYRIPYYAWGYSYYLNKYYPITIDAKIKEADLLNGVCNSAFLFKKDKEDKEWLYSILPFSFSIDWSKNPEFIFVFPVGDALPVSVRMTSILKRAEDLNIRMILTNQVYFASNVFLHNRKQKTGFYSHDWGLLPFKLALQKTALEEFYIYKLRQANDNSREIK